MVGVEIDFNGRQREKGKKRGKRVKSGGGEEEKERTRKEETKKKKD